MMQGFGGMGGMGGMGGLGGGMGGMGGGGGKGGHVPEMRGPVENRVYVGNLPWQCGWQDLKDHMKKVGEVVYADIFMEDSGRSRGCGLVAYRTAEAAQRAALELNDVELFGRKLLVREDREDASEGRQGCRVYVGNLAWGATWKELKDHFRIIGDVKRADVISESYMDGGRSKGYGIIEFKTEEEAQKAIANMQDTEILGRKIFVREDRERAAAGRQQQLPPMSWGAGKGQGVNLPWGGSASAVGAFEKGGVRYAVVPQGPSYGKGNPKGPGTCGYEPFTKVFCGNLPYTLKWQELKDVMRQVGDVVHAEIMTESGEPDGKSKGCGIVEFGTFGAAKRAVQYMNDTPLQGRLLLVREYREETPGAGKGGPGASSFLAMGKGKSL